jgi:hypothetical protein
MSVRMKVHPSASDWFLHIFEKWQKAEMKTAGVSSIDEAYNNNNGHAEHDDDGDVKKRRLDSYKRPVIGLAPGPNQIITLEDIDRKDTVALFKLKVRNHHHHHHHHHFFRLSAPSQASRHWSLLI